MGSPLVDRCHDLRRSIESSNGEWGSGDLRGSSRLARCERPESRDDQWQCGPTQ